MKKLAAILVPALLSVSAFADPAETGEVDSTYFHPAASLYIQGDTTSASNLVAKGLSIYPDNGKLKRLKELLEKQQKQDQKDKDNQQNKDKDKDKDKDKKKQDQDQDKKKDDKKQDQDKKQNQQENKDQQQQQPPEPQPSTEQMSKDEAEQLLDAMRQEEQNKRMQLHPVFGAPVKVDKDW